jgi:CheY-like chemotaxis protein
MSTSEAQTVLVVDDDQDLLSLVAFVLESEGFHVETASDGRQALDAVAKHLPNLILLDMKMPVMDGWEFAKQFHSKYDSQAPIVVLTAYEDAKKRAQEIGANGWVGKPFDLDALVNIVKQNIAA